MFCFPNRCIQLTFKHTFFLFAGETTFDKVFFRHQLSTLTEEEDIPHTIVQLASPLRESPVSQHFDDRLSTDGSFTGSHTPFWMSLFSCGQLRSRVSCRPSTIRRRVGSYFRALYEYIFNRNNNNNSDDENDENNNRRGGDIERRHSLV